MSERKGFRDVKVIITGSTGMVGRGVLLECLDDDRVVAVLAVNRRPLDIQHPRLTEIILNDFGNPGPIRDELKGYDACFFCMGVSSVGMDEKGYTRLTYHLTTCFADVLKELNPGMVFNYVSGAGTDSTEQGRLMWARVKGRTENTLLKMGFRDAYMFRPGIILPERGIRSRTGWVQGLLTVMRPFFPLLGKFKSVTTTSKIGRAMINAVYFPQEMKRLKGPAINALAGM